MKSSVFYIFVAVVISISAKAEMVINLTVDKRGKLVDTINPKLKITSQNCEVKKDAGKPAVITFDKGKVRIDGRKFYFQNFSFLLWISPVQMTKVTPESVLRGPGGNGFHNSYRLFFNSVAGVMKPVLNMNFGGRSPRSITGPGIPCERFSMITVTCDDNRVCMYVNGKLAGTLDKKGKTINYIKRTRDLFLGFAHFKLFIGKMSGFKFYDNILAANDINNIYQKEKELYKPSGKTATRKSKRPNYYENDELCIPSRPGKDNLAVNPSFEAGTRYWRGSGYIIDRPVRLYDIDKTEAFSGQRSLRLNNFKGESETWIECFAIPVKTGETYTASFYAKTDVPGMKIQARIITGVWPVFPVSRRFTLSEKWRRYSMTFKAPNNIALIMLRGERKPPVDYRIWLDGVQIVKGSAPVKFTEPEVIAKLNTGRRNNIYQPGEAMYPVLEIAAGKKCKGKVKITGFDFLKNKLLSEEHEFKTGDDGRTKLALDFNGKLKKGSNVIRVDFTLDNGFKSYDYFRVGVMDFLVFDFPHRQLFAVGNISYIPDSETALTRTWNAGFGAIVPFGHWYPNHYFRKLSDKGFVTLESIGQHGHISSSFKKKSRKHGNGSFDMKYRFKEITDGDLKTIAANTRSVVRNLPDVKYWKLLNEPGGIQEGPGNMDKFVKVLKVVAENIKKVNPKLKIISPEPTNMYPAKGIRLVESMAENGLLDFVDIVGIHPYRPRPESPDLDAHIKLFLDMLAKYGCKKDVWFTEQQHFETYIIPELGLETTVHSNNWRGKVLSYDLGFGERLASAYNMRSWLISLKYSGRVKLHCEWMGGNYLLDLGAVPRLQYWMPNTLGHLLGDAKFVRDVDICAEIRCYIFRDGKGRPVAAIWNFNEDIDRGKKSPAEIFVPFAESEAEIFDMALNPVKFAKDQPVKITYAPVFIRGGKLPFDEFVKRMKNIRQRGGTFKSISINTAFTAKDAIKITLMNRLSSKLAGTVKISAGGGEKIVRQLDLAPKSSEAISLNIPKSNQMIRRVPVTAGFKAKGESKEQSVEAVYSLITSRKISKPPVIDGVLTDWDKKYAIDVPLAYKKFRVPPEKAGEFPNGAKCGGKDDLSARLYTAWDNENFYFALKVNDDVLKNIPGGKSGQHNYDGVQVYFDTLGDARNREFTGFDNNDYCYNLFVQNGKLQVTRNPVPEWQLCFLKKGNAPEVKRAYKKVPGGMVYEAAFPAKSLSPLTLKKNYSFGFSMIVNDNDQGFRERGLVLMPSNFEPYAKPHMWPVMILEDN